MNQLPSAITYPEIEQDRSPLSSFPTEQDQESIINMS